MLSVFPLSFDYLLLWLKVNPAPPIPRMPLPPNPALDLVEYTRNYLPCQSSKTEKCGKRLPEASPALKSHSTQRYNDNVRESLDSSIRGEQPWSKTIMREPVT